MPIPAFPNVSTSLATYGGEYSPFGTELTSPSTASSTTVLSPPGFWMVKTAAHTYVQYSPNGGGGTQRLLVTTNSGGVVFSDGISVEIANDSTGGTTAFYTQILGNV